MEIVSKSSLKEPKWQNHHYQKENKNQILSWDTNIQVRNNLLENIIHSRQNSNNYVLERNRKLFLAEKKTNHYYSDFTTV